MVQDASRPTDAGEVKENDAPQEGPPPKPSGKGMRAMQGLDSPPPTGKDTGVAASDAMPEKQNDKAESMAEAHPDSFELTDWSGYPDGPKPEGPFRIVEGQEYENARALADQTNRTLHRDNSSLEGLDIHEVHPVKFGGSPTDLDNKIFVTPREHAKYTTWWNNVLSDRTSG
jgi:hypothetical protein